MKGANIPHTYQRMHPPGRLAVAPAECGRQREGGMRPPLAANPTRARTCNAVLNLRPLHG